MNKDFYDEKFYVITDAQKSAGKIVPILMKLIRPKSVVDVGCGTGEFLAEFSKQGVENILGIDGDWVKKKVLQFPELHFMAADLQKEIKLDKKFELAISTEVGEHLPESSADAFVLSLTNLADVVVFSAAIPLQQGVNHLNEQWPQYWADRFKKYGFIAKDIIRYRIWNDSDIKFWYRQNMVVYVKETQKEAYPGLVPVLNELNEVLPLVHPELFNFHARVVDKILKKTPSPIKWLIKKFNRSN